MSCVAASIIEIKASRDVLAHNNGIVNAIYVAKAGSRARHQEGEQLTMSEQYRVQNGYSVLSQQHAAIDIPHVRAVADAIYGVYQTNVPIETPGPDTQ